MRGFPELDQRIGMFADRLRAFQQERDKRAKLAMEMLAKIEERVRSQQSALDRANRRIADLEKERDAAVARVSEIIEIYESSLVNNDVFLKGIEDLANKIVGSPPAPPKPEVAAPRPVPPRPAVVQAPSRTPFLKEMGPEHLQPRDRLKPNGGSGQNG